jgi:hypothetical protein
VIEQRQPGPTGSIDLQTRESEASLAETLRARSMNYWLEKTSAADIGKLWNELQVAVRDVQPRILLDVWASGTISGRGYRAVVTACTTGDGFVLTFTVQDT